METDSKTPEFEEASADYNTPRAGIPQRTEPTRGTDPVLRWRERNFV